MHSLLSREVRIVLLIQFDPVSSRHPLDRLESMPTTIVVAHRVLDFVPSIETNIDHYFDG